jgi:hypothetical protein
MPDPITPLSDAIIRPITKAYRVGGFGLAFLLLGAIMILLGALISVGVFVYPLAFVGLLLIVIPCYFFYAKEIRPIATARKIAAQNGEMIDAVQATAIEVTNLTLVLQALAFKHAGQIVQALDVARPQIRAIPVIGDAVESRLFGKTDELARVIVSTTGTVQVVVENVQQALIQSDAKRLQKYLQDLKEIEGQVKSVLASPVLKSVAIPGMSGQINLDAPLWDASARTRIAQHSLEQCCRNAFLCTDTSRSSAEARALPVAPIVRFSAEEAALATGRDQRPIGGAGAPAATNGLSRCVLTLSAHRRRYLPAGTRRRAAWMPGLRGSGPGIACQYPGPRMVVSASSLRQFLSWRDTVGHQHASATT